MTKLAWLTATLTLCMAGFAFTLSFVALTDLAGQHAVPIPFLFPLIVEAGVIVFSFNAVYRSNNRLATWWPWMLVICSSILAGTFNVIHAPADLVSQLIAAMPSLFLLLSFEALLSQVKHESTRRAVLASIDDLQARAAELATNRDDLAADIDRLTASREALRQEMKLLRKEKSAANGPIKKSPREMDEAERLANLDYANQARQPTQTGYDLAARLRAEGLTWPEVAQEIDRSPSTAKRWAAMARPSEPALNGHERSIT